MSIPSNARTDVPTRVTAAVALFYLGEETGSEWIEAFTEYKERDITEFDRLLSTEGDYADFQQTIRYLRSSETDTLFLMRLEHNYLGSDGDLVQDVAFLADHANEVIPLLRKHLEGRTWTSRKDAAWALESILGVQVDWDEYALAGAQPEKVQLLKHEANIFLAGWMPRSG